MKQRKEEILARRIDGYKRSRENVVKSALKIHQNKKETPANLRPVKFKFTRQKTTT